MEIHIPTQVIFYTLGAIGVVIIVVLVSGSISLVDRYITRKQMEKASREE